MRALAAPLALAFLLPTMVICLPAPESFYRAAVVQGLFPNASTTQAALVESFVQSAAAEGAQILVFAESALGSDTALAHRATCEPLPDPALGPVYLCNTTTVTTPLASQISCAARRHNIVVVFAMCDVQGADHFNTQLAVGPDGRLLAKYHKMHLYDPFPGSGESTHASYPADPDPRWFDTPFGVRFGMHTCFDMAFATPGAAMALDPRLAIRDFVFPTGWVVAAPPMLPPNEVQQGWSRGLGVNLLAADSAHSWGSSGSGIYSRGRVLAKRVLPTAFPDSGHLLVADVPRLRRSTPNVQATPPDWAYKTNATAVEGTAVEAAAVIAAPAEAKAPPVGLTTFTPSWRQPAMVVRATSASGFTCDLRYSLAPRVADSQAGTAPELFALFALDGSWLHGVVRSRSCLIFRCRTPACTLDPLYVAASDLFNTTTVFSSIELSGNFSGGDIVIPMLATVGGDVVDNDDSLQFDGGYLVAPDFDRPLLNAMLFASV